MSRVTVFPLDPMVWLTSDNKFCYIKWRVTALPSTYVTVHKGHNQHLHRPAAPSESSREFWVHVCGAGFVYFNGQQSMEEDWEPMSVRALWAICPSSKSMWFASRRLIYTSLYTRSFLATFCAGLMNTYQNECACWACSQWWEAAYSGVGCL